MSYATVQSCTLAGIHALPVTVEIHISGGLPGMSIVGLPQSAVRESKDRVKSAIVHCGLKFPMVKIVVNLAPADLPKQGGRFDLPIALGVLMATNQLPEDALNNLVVVGELGLTGKVRAVSGALPTALAYRSSNNALIMPDANRVEAMRSVRTKLYVASELTTLFAQLKRHQLTPVRPGLTIADNTNEQSIAAIDMCEVRGQVQARRALEIAAAGSHNMIMIGPPGTGKSMLASRMPSIQPAMSEQESMETASIHSISHTGFDESQWGVRPFRSPHHTASGVALVGGGSKPMPGEISLAHNGVLFLDELSEFPRAVLDVLREPMETGNINIARAAKQCEFPARFQLIAAMNPCPCGYLGDSNIQCRCTPDQIARYAMRISGPFLDRIDLHVQVNRLARNQLLAKRVEESSAVVRGRVCKARAKQLLRQKVMNAQLSGSALDKHVPLANETQQLLSMASDQLSLSLRAVHRVLRVTRTIADLAGSAEVTKEHMVEALSYRQRSEQR